MTYSSALQSGNEDFHAVSLGLVGFDAFYGSSALILSGREAAPACIDELFDFESLGGCFDAREAADDAKLFRLDILVGGLLSCFDIVDQVAHGKCCFISFQILEDQG